MRVLLSRCISTFTRLETLRIHSKDKGLTQPHFVVNKLCRLCSSANNYISAQSVEVLNIDENVNIFEDEQAISSNLKNVLKPPLSSEEVDVICPPPIPLNSFSCWVDKSETLQKLVAMGVNIGAWDKQVKKLEFIVTLDFQKHIIPYIEFIKKCGVLTEDLGRVFTQNPTIFKENLGNLQVRINYLESKKFSHKQIQRIITRTPNWLRFDVLTIDKSLGYFQKMFKLKGNEVRQLATVNPNIILDQIAYPMKVEATNLFFLNEMKFTPEHVNAILLKRPRIFIEDHTAIMDRYNYIIENICLDNETIVQHPTILLLRKRKLVERDGFLKFMGLNQYDSQKPNYISPTEFALRNDDDFATNVAKLESELFKKYLKTL